MVQLASCCCSALTAQQSMCTASWHTTRGMNTCWKSPNVHWDCRKHQQTQFSRNSSSNTSNASSSSSNQTTAGSGCCITWMRSKAMARCSALAAALVTVCSACSNPHSYELFRAQPAVHLTDTWQAVLLVRISRSSCATNTTKHYILNSPNSWTASSNSSSDIANGIRYFSTALRYWPTECVAAWR